MPNFRTLTEKKICNDLSQYFLSFREITLSDLTGFNKYHLVTLKNSQ